MIRLTIEGNTAEEMVNQLRETMENLFNRATVNGQQDNLVKVPEKVEVAKPEPVEHKVEQPTLEEVRAALLELRGRKGSAAVKDLLFAYGADSLQQLKPEDYLGALARAKTEV